MHACTASTTFELGAKKQRRPFVPACASRTIHYPTYSPCLHMPNPVDLYYFRPHKLRKSKFSWVIMVVLEHLQHSCDTALEKKLSAARGNSPTLLQ
jgi:hypothetical protein